MIDSFTVRNFRSFREVQLSDCRRVNVVVGDNGSGKTALLEALFLAAGVTPELVLRTRGWRSGTQAQVQGTPEDIHDSLWGDLFHKFQTTKPAFVKLEGKGTENRSVTVTLNKKGQVRIVPPSRKKPHERAKPVPIPFTPIQFRWSIQNYGDVIIEPSLQDGKLFIQDSPADPIKAAFYPANQTPSSAETATRFSLLSQSFHEQEFVESIGDIFPTIRNLSLETTAGSATIFAAVEGLPRKIPLSLASGGMSKLVAILLGITDQSGGIVLIDELENGFYFRHLAKVWSALLDFARRYDCQLFVSTHSAECLDAAAALAKENPGDFCMLRVVNSGDGSGVRRFDGKRFADAVMGDVEVR